MKNEILIPLAGLLKLNLTRCPGKRARRVCCYKTLVIVARKNRSDKIQLYAYFPLPLPPFHRNIFDLCSMRSGYELANLFPSNFLSRRESLFLFDVLFLPLAKFAETCMNRTDCIHSEWICIFFFSICI